LGGSRLPAAAIRQVAIVGMRVHGWCVGVVEGWGCGQPGDVQKARTRQLAGLSPCAASGVSGGHDPCRGRLLGRQRYSPRWRRRCRYPVFGASPDGRCSGRPEHRTSPKACCGTTDNVARWVAPLPRAAGHLHVDLGRQPARTRRESVSPAPAGQQWPCRRWSHRPPDRQMLTPDRVDHAIAPAARLRGLHNPRMFGEQGKSASFTAFPAG
jgi:hypothetical protein